jgi:alcohol dehydrogenase (cytochrome c)
MRNWLLKYWRALLGAIVVIGIAVAGLLYIYWDKAVPIAALAINYVRYWSAPAGTLETEVAPTGAATQPPAPTASASPKATSGATEVDWLSCGALQASCRAI